MEYNSSKSLICIRNAKEASLYFNEVIPLNMVDLLEEGSSDSFKILHEILPASLVDKNSKDGIHPGMMRCYIAYQILYLAQLSDMTQDEKSKLEDDIFRDITSDIKDILLISNQKVGSIYGQKENSEIDSEGDPAMILSGLNLVDTSKISWKHIIELRQDKESVKKLRRLRTFIFEKYQGKPMSFIEDDLLNKIDSYEKTTKKWGLETNESAFKVIFSSVGIVAITAATIATAFLGLPLAIPIATAVGSSFSIGNLALEIRKHKRDLYQFKDDNPVTYLIDIKKKERNVT